MDAQAQQPTVQRNDWERISHAAEYAAAVRRALAAGAHLTARQIAERGANLHPDDAELAKMARILAPPKFVRTERASHRSTAANQAWLRQHFTDYKGTWVALRDGELVAAAHTIRDLKAAVPTFAGMMITRV